MFNPFFCVLKIIAFFFRMCGFNVFEWGFDYQRYGVIIHKWLMNEDRGLYYPVCWGLLQYGSEKLGISDISPPGSQENLRNDDAEREWDQLGRGPGFFLLGWLSTKGR